MGTAAFTTSPALVAGLPMVWWRRRPAPGSQVREPRCTRYLGVICNLAPFLLLLTGLQNLMISPEDRVIRHAIRIVIVLKSCSYLLGSDLLQPALCSLCSLSMSLYVCE